MNRKRTADNRVYWDGTQDPIAYSRMVSRRKDENDRRRRTEVNRAAVLALLRERNPGAMVRW